MPWMSINEFKEKFKMGEPTNGDLGFRLVGMDAFSGEYYDLGYYPSEEEAKSAAQGRLEILEKLQPSKSSGGQSGIQDQVYIEKPDGTPYRVFPA